MNHKFILTTFNVELKGLEAKHIFVKKCCQKGMLQKYALDPSVLYPDLFISYKLYAIDFVRFKAFVMLHPLIQEPVTDLAGNVSGRRIAADLL